MFSTFSKAVLCLTLLPYSLLAQFSPLGPNGGRYGATDFGGGPQNLTTIRAVGIGDFRNNVAPSAILHIDQTTLPPLPSVGLGDVFRTDAPAGSNTFWRMFRGGTEEGRLFTTNSAFGLEAVDGKPLLLRTTQAQPMQFFTANAERMRIQADGRVGIGTNNPEAGLDINGRVRVRDLSGGDRKINTGLVSHDALGNLYTINFNGNTTDVLRGDGTWGPVRDEEKLQMQQKIIELEKRLALLETALASR